MRGFLTLVVGACLTGALGAQQAPSPNPSGSLWISVGESARLTVNGEAVGVVDKLRVLPVPLGRHVVRVESLREKSVSVERTVVVSSDQPVAVTFDLATPVGALRQAQAVAERQARNERQAPILARFSVTVTDSQTGLEWAGRDSGGPISWTNANAYCEKLALGGADDWRLPTLGELEALLTAVKGGGMEEASNGAFWYPVPGVRASYTRFWTNTMPLIIDFAPAGQPDRGTIAHIVDFGTTEFPRIRVNPFDTPPSPASALCVRR